MRRLLMWLMILVALLMIKGSVQAQDAPQNPPPGPCDANMITTIRSEMRARAKDYDNVDLYWSAVQDDATAHNCTLASSEEQFFIDRWNDAHPSPTPTIDQGALASEGTDPERCGLKGHTCCTGFPPNQVVNNSGVSQTGQDESCPSGLKLPIPLLDFCLDDILGGVRGLVLTTVGGGDLEKIGTCKQNTTDPDDPDHPDRPVPLIPVYDDTSGNCVCQLNDSNEALFRTGNCRYIASSKHLTTAEQIANDKEMTQCNSCLASGGHWSAIGCLHSENPKKFIEDKILGVGISFGGLAAFVCIIYAAIMMQTSSGNPERIKNAQQMLTSCIMGLMLIIFSIFILRLIGVTILHIPGLG